MKQTKLITLLILLLTLGACNTDQPDSPLITPLQIEVKAPLNSEGELSELQGVIISMDNKVKELTFNEKGVSNIELTEGKYIIEVSANFRFTDKHQMIRDEVLKLTDNIELKGDTKVIKTLQFSKSETTGSFLIEEIFFSGTNTKEGNQYDNDKYIKITNNSSQTLYADGLTLLVSHFSADDKKHNLQPNIIQEKFPVKMAYQIKGSGTDYPVKPSESIILCQSAIDHREFNPQSFSLLEANFEWLSEQAATDGEFPNNPNVPNMTLVYANDNNGVWSVNNNGNETFAIAQLSTDFIEQISNSHIYEYTEDLIIDGTNYGSYPGEPALAVPNELILDAVNLCPKNDHQWLPISPLLDNGFTYVAKDHNSSMRYTLSVIRKSIIKDGIKILIDSNDSSSDFEISNPATLLNK